MPNSHHYLVIFFTLVFSIGFPFRRMSNALSAAVRRYWLRRSVLYLAEWDRMVAYAVVRQIVPRVVTRQWFLLRNVNYLREKSDSEFLCIMLCRLGVFTRKFGLFVTKKQTFCILILLKRVSNKNTPNLEFWWDEKKHCGTRTEQYRRTEPRQHPIIIVEEGSHTDCTCRASTFCHNCRITATDTTNMRISKRIPKQTNMEDTRLF